MRPPTDAQRREQTRTTTSARRRAQSVGSAADHAFEAETHEQRGRQHGREQPFHRKADRIRERQLREQGIAGPYRPSASKHSTESQEIRSQRGFDARRAPTIANAAAMLPK